MLANERQRACAAEAAELLSDVCGTIEAGYTLDAVDVALESALSALFRLTGEKSVTGWWTRSLRSSASGNKMSKI